ncbi:transcription termination factor NusA [Merdimmobilis hominis]|nr:transcription termination factor NusA [Merdimmobilis hominis]
MMNNHELFEALEALEREKGIKAEAVLDSIKNAIAVAVRKYYNVGENNVEVELNQETRKFQVSIVKDIVEEVTDPTTQISFEDAYEKNKRVRVGARLSMRLDTKQIGRIAALSGKNLIHQGINDAVKAQLMEQYQSKLHEIVNARVQKIEPRTGNVTVSIDKNEAILFASEQIPGETFHEGDFIKVYVNDVVSSERRCTIKVTRTHKDLVKRLFEKEVPEIFDGTVEVKSISREAGSRTKIAVFSKDPNIDPVGACIGQRNSRVSNIVKELNGEKIDIIKYSEDPAEFIAAALAPSSVVRVDILSTEERTCRVIVPDMQLSLAIGNKGQNAKLAAKLTGYKIDIRPESSDLEETEASSDTEAQQPETESTETVAE